jgi:hypothetical protein
LNPVFLLAGALLFDEKIHQIAALFWFGVRDVEILYSQAAIQTINVFPAFLEHAWFGGKDRGLSTCKPCSKQAGGWIPFLHEAAQNFELILNVQDQSKNLKTHRGLMSFSRPI